MRQTAGYRRYDTAGELDLLNQIWALQRLLTNLPIGYFSRLTPRAVGGGGVWSMTNHLRVPTPPLALMG